MGERDNYMKGESKKKQSIEQILSKPQNLKATLQEARETSDIDNLSMVEKSSGLNTYVQGSPEGQKSVVSAHLQSKDHDSQMEMMLNGFQQNNSQGEGQSFINKEGEESELDPNQIDLENLNESELMALQNQGMDDGDEEEDMIDVDNPEDLARKGLKRI